MARFTKALKQQIIEEFAQNNGGVYDPAAFVAEVRKRGKKHPAWEWFEWDDDKAADEYRVWQARAFATGLRVKFEVQTVHRGAMRIVERSAPLVLSPMGNRRDGGGYFVNDPRDADHMDELCRQAAQALRWFLHRYSAALEHVGVSVTTIEKALGALEHAGIRQDEAA